MTSLVHIAVEVEDYSSKYDAIKSRYAHAVIDSILFYPQPY